MAGQKIGQSLRAGPRFFYGYVVVVAALLTMSVSYGANNTFSIFSTGY